MQGLEGAECNATTGQNITRVRHGLEFGSLWSDPAYHYM
jgi:hypothetical protein